MFQGLCKWVSFVLFKITILMRFKKKMSVKYELLLVNNRWISKNAETERFLYILISINMFTCYRFSTLYCYHKSMLYKIWPAVNILFIAISQRREKKKNHQVSENVAKFLLTTLLTLFIVLSSIINWNKPFSLSYLYNIFFVDDPFPLHSIFF